MNGNKCLINNETYKMLYKDDIEEKVRRQKKRVRYLQSQSPRIPRKMNLYGK